MLPLNVKKSSAEVAETAEVLRDTGSVCPVCLRFLPARITCRGTDVFLEKECPEHGEFRILISRNAADYRMLSGYYFYFLPGKLPQKEYYLNITTRCNIKCPVCYLDNYREVEEMDENTVIEAAAKRVKRFTFSHGEPTASRNLVRNIKILKRAGKMVNMHTNALKLADYDYARSLKEAGIDHISVQIDGFSGQAQEKLRGADILDRKLKALENLEKLSVPVTLNPTVSRSVNSGELGRILEFAAAKKFIKDISFITYSHYRAEEAGMEDYIMPDEVLDLLASQSRGLIRREEVVDFQKLFFAYMSVFGKRKCFYYFHYFLVRTGRGLAPVSEYIDLKKAAALLEKIKQGQRRLNMPGFLRILLVSLKARALSWLPSELFCFLRGGYPRRPGRLLGITLATICDPRKYDRTVAENCGQGIVDEVQCHESYGSFLMETLKR